MDDAVQTTPIDQGASVSQTDKVSEGTQIANTSVDNTSESTREVANTPDVKEATPETAQEQTIQPSRSITRQQELANRVRSLEMANAQLRQGGVPQQAQYNPNIPMNDEVLTQVKYRQDLLEAKMQLDEERSQFAEAEAEFPELKTDREFDDAVYDIYLARKSRGETIHPRDIAKQVKKLMSKAENAGMAKAENAISEKSGAGIGMRRSDTNSADDDQQSQIRAAKNLAKSNGFEGAVKFLEATGM